MSGIRRMVVAISGMRTNACRERVAEALGRVEGVTDVDVSLIRARATVLHKPECDSAGLMRAVAVAGYTGTPDRTN